jgi:hypothetical protein
MTTDNQWRTIDSAPKIASVNESTKPFLGWCPDEDYPEGGCVRVCWWEPQMKGGQWYGDRDLRENPSHWLPCPPKPTDAKP